MSNLPSRERVSELDNFYQNMSQRKKMTVTLSPSQEVDTDRLVYLLGCIMRETGLEFKSVENGETLPPGWLSQMAVNTIGIEGKTERGRFAVRFLKYIKDTTGIKLNDTVKSQIGNAHNECRESGRDFICDIVNDFSWHDGEFGHSGSCWWSRDGSYSTSRDTLYNSGGYCLRIYDTNGEGIGRTWLYTGNEKRVYLFNSYGIDIKDAARIVVRLLSEFAGEDCKYRSCNIDSPGYFYVNSGKGRVVYPDSDTRDDMDIDMGETLEQKQDIFESVYAACESCGEICDADDCFTVYDTCLCRNCYENQAFYCERCNEDRWTDDAVTVDGELVCERCARHANYCERCNEYTFSDCKEVDGDTVCENCAEDANYCERCGEYTFGDTHEVDGDTVCDDCAKQIEEEVTVEVQ